MNTVLLIAVLLISIVLLLSSIVKIEATYFAIPTRFGKRLKRVLFEGIRLKWPFIDRVKPEYIYSLKPATFPTKFKFISKDNRELTLEGLVRWQPDPDIKKSDVGMVTEEQEDVCRFVDITPETLKEGLNSKIESEIGRFGGLNDWIVFRDKRRPVESYLNCILRLEQPPHTNPLKVLKEQLEKPEHAGLIERLEELGSTEESPEVPAEASDPKDTSPRLEFYDIFSGPIGELLREESQGMESSYDEKFYGIDILELTIEEIGFDEETKKALGEEQRAHDIAGAANVRNEQKLVMAEELREKGKLDPQSAIDSAELNLGQAAKNVHSVVGGGNPVLVMKGGE